MKILVSGSSGLIGASLTRSLQQKGDHIFRLFRAPNYQTRSTDIVWNPITGEIDANALEGFDAVIHLAGEGIADGRWTNEKKERIRSSRILPTKNLSRILAQLHRPPKTFLCASAVGYYGDQKNNTVDENSPNGQGFLAEVCQEWESATKAANSKGIRVVNLRLGVVLSPLGGALEKMLLPFKLGLGGRLGEGVQYMSWIDLADVIDIVRYTLHQESMQGPVNAVSPHPVTNLEFTKTLGKVLRRPTLFPAPPFALRLLLGEMADAMLLSSLRVVPTALTKNGFRFRFPDLESSLRHLLAR